MARRCRAIGADDDVRGLRRAGRPLPERQQEPAGQSPRVGQALGGDADLLHDAMADLQDAAAPAIADDVPHVRAEPERATQPHPPPFDPPPVDPPPFDPPPFDPPPLWLGGGVTPDWLSGRLVGRSASPTHTRRSPGAITHACLPVSQYWKARRLP